MPLDSVQALIRLHEGLRLKPYRDTVGKLTIGYGRNLDDRGITKDEAEQLLRNDITRVTSELATALPWFLDLDPIRRAVLIDMAFNLGAAGLLKFALTLRAVEHADHARASQEMLDSVWATQVGTRATRLSEMMASGTWPEL